jgi:HAD superfamily hydrolase (TIGR01509 family)
VPTIEAVIFDCDGTLVDSEPISIRVLLDLVADLGLPLPFEEAVSRYSGNDLAVVFHDIESKLGRSLPHDFLDCFRHRQIEVLQEQLRPIDGAAELLSALHLPSCVASNAPTDKIRVCLETTNLHHHFEVEEIFSAYQIQTWKPEPDLFLMAAAALNIPPEKCAVVEDSVFGIQAGLAAGMQVFAYDPHGRYVNDQRITSTRSLPELLPAFGCPSESSR